MMWQAKLAAAAICAAVFFGGVAGYGQHRYSAGYAAAEKRAAQQQQTDIEQMRQAQYRASATYQAAKAEREAAERLNRETLAKLAQSADYQRDCFDDSGLRQLQKAIGGD